MRKLLALILILGMATAASASIDLSVNGLPAPDVITLEPSMFITLDINVSAGQYLGGGDIAIRLSNPQGHLDPGGVTFINPVPTELFPGTVFPLAWTSPWAVVPLFSGPQQVYMSGGNSQYNTLGPYKLMDGLLFHCDDFSDVIIELVSMGLGVAKFEGGNPVIIYQPGQIIDSIYVIQPEPATMALLALGGLALLRRRR